MRALHVLLVGLLVLALPALTAAEGLSNGLETVQNKYFRMSLLTAAAVSHGEGRSFLKLAKDVATLCTRAERLGVVFDRRLDVFLLHDLDVPAMDVWRHFGVTPDEAFFAALEQRLAAGSTCASRAALDEHAASLLRDFPFLQHVPLPRWKETCMGWGEAAAGSAEGPSADEVSTFVAQLRASLERSVADAPGVYGLVKASAYNPRLAMICVLLEGKAAMHRFEDVALHETGHHVYRMLVKQSLRELPTGATYSEDQLDTLAFAHLEGLNELFADWMSIASGHNIVLAFYDPKRKVPDEIKRKASKDRTLGGFASEAGANPGLGKYYGEDHLILNPSRTLLWHLKLELGLDVTTRLFVEAVRGYLREFFGEDVPRCAHQADPTQGQGCFTLGGYDQGIVAANVRVLEALRAAAVEALDGAQRVTFERLAVQFFGDSARPVSAPAGRTADPAPARP